MYSKVLIANRGEIANRIITSLQDHGIETVVTASDIDLNSVVTRKSDKILRLPGQDAITTYLNIDKIIRKAKELEVEAIHPGYGFLSENPIFAEEVINNNMDFIGPLPEQMKFYGDKISARKIAMQANVPIIEGSDAMSDDDDLFEIAKNIGFPILLKASAGGGGRGIRLVQSEEEFFPHLNQAKNEARLAFNDDRIFIEKYIEKGRHIEVQILGLPDGQVLHFGERDCTIQRKNQKLIEETPAPFMSKQIIKEIHESAINLVSTSNYTNAGTVEFIFDMNSNKFYFLEVNTRIQVEHPVTEMVTGEDLIWRQIQVANGENINLTQEDIKIKGHAIQSRIYAEDPFNGFQPSPGTINRVIHPVGAGVRVDTAIEDGSSVSSYYDSMIAKLIVHSPNRSAAIRKMINNLSNYLITGVHTTVPYIKQVISSPDFSNFSYHTKYLDENKFTIPEEIMDISRIIASKFSMGKNSQQSFQKRISNWKLSSLS